MQKQEEDLKFPGLNLNDYLGDDITDKNSPEEDSNKTKQEMSDAIRGVDKTKDPLYLDIEEEQEDNDPPAGPPKEEIDNKDEGSKEKPETPKPEEGEPEEEEELNKDKPRGRDNSEDSPEEPEKSDNPSGFYRKALRKLFGDTVDTITVEEDGEDVEMSLDDLDISEDQFQEIVQAKYDLDKQEALEGKVDITGASDFAKKILDIDKAGGSYSDLLEMKEAYTDPLSQLNFEDPNDQKEAIFLRYKAKNDLADEEISAIIQGFERSGTLKEKSLAAKEELEEAVNKAAEEREKQTKKLKEEALEKEKEYKAKMKESLSGYQLKDSVKEKLVNLATSRGEDGVYELDKVYSEAITDPDKAVELALYFFDRDEFFAQKANEQVTEAKKKTAKTLKISGNNKPSAQSQKRSKKPKASSGININEI